MEMNDKTNQYQKQVLLFPTLTCQCERKSTQMFVYKMQTLKFFKSKETYPLFFAKTYCQYRLIEVNNRILNMLMYEKITQIRLWDPRTPRQKVITFFKSSEVNGIGALRFGKKLHCKFSVY